MSESYAKRLTRQEVMDAYARYSAQYGAGKKPAEEEGEPTIEQLSSINFLLYNEEAPFVDFAVFRPQAQRAIKKQRLTGKVFNPRGELVDVEIAGPPTFQHFKACHIVLINSLLMLNAVDL